MRSEIKHPRISWDVVYRDKTTYVNHVVIVGLGGNFVEAISACLIKNAKLQYTNVKGHTNIL